MIWFLVPSDPSGPRGPVQSTSPRTLALGHVNESRITSLMVSLQTAVSDPITFLACSGESPAAGLYDRMCSQFPMFLHGPTNGDPDL